MGDRNQGRVLGIFFFLAIGFALFARVTDLSDEDQIAAVIEEWSTSTEAENCSTLVTQAYLEQSYDLEGSEALAACEQESAAPVTSAFPDAVQVGDIEISRDVAMADVTFDGGTVDGSTVRLRLVETGGDWRLDMRLGFETLDRAKAESGYEELLRASPDAFSAAGARCAAARLERLPKASLEELLINPDVKTFATHQVSCDRAAFERLMSSALAKPPYDLSGDTVACLERAVSPISDEELVDLYVETKRYQSLVSGCEARG